MLLHYSSFEVAHERLRQLPAGTSVAAFRDFHLQLRGVVDDDFVERAIWLIPNDSESAVIETALEDMSGRSIAVGEYPPWQQDSPNVIPGYPPYNDGTVKRGVY